MKAKDMREKSAENLAELEKSLTREAFQARFKNFTARLDDTSSLKKARRDVARVRTILAERARGVAAPPPKGAPAKAPAAKAVKAEKPAAAAAKPVAKASAKTKVKKASEASK